MAMGRVVDLLNELPFLHVDQEGTDQASTDKKLKERDWPKNLKILLFSREILIHGRQLLIHCPVGMTRNSIA